MTRVILFRTPAAGDVYASAFSELGYAVTSIPALADTLLPDDLAPILRRGGQEWEAAIVTSRRAAEAWVKAVAIAGPLEGEPWSSVPVWSPGGAVGSVLASSGIPECYIPQGAPTAVSAAALAPLILSAPPRISEYRPYLVLTGDKTLPLLTDTLRAARREVVRVKVYETRQDPDLSRAVGVLKRDLACGGEGKGADGKEGEDRQDSAPWFALFSPSSAGFVLPLLWEAGFAVKEEEGGRPVRVAAIGETTESALRKEGWRVDAVAKTPDAEGLVAAIVESDARMNAK